MTPASKRTWHRIADRLKEMGLRSQGEGNLPQWLLNVVLKSRDPKLTDLVAKLMSRGLDELEQEEREALFGAIIGDESKE